MLLSNYRSEEILTFRTQLIDYSHSLFVALNSLY